MHDGDEPAAQAPRALFEVGPQLPSGRHDLEPEEVTRRQRERACHAVLATIGERTYAAMSVRQVLERAGISRGTFYVLFDDLDACFVEAYETVVARVRAAVAAAVDETTSWPAALRIGLGVVFDIVAAQPAIARACVIEIHGVVPAGRARVPQALHPFLEFLESGYDELGGAGLGRELAAELTLGGIGELVAGHLVRGEASALPGRADEIADWCTTSLGARLWAGQLSGIAHG